MSTLGVDADTSRTRPPGLRRRFWRLMLFFGRGLISLWLFDYFLPRVLGLTWLRAGARGRHRKLAMEFRELAIELGGVMIKLGQFLSTRVDVMPPEVTEPLSGLQDKVAPVAWPGIEQQLIREFEAPPTEVFAWIDETALAAASLGQVHLAKLESGEKVAVKIQRPGIEAIIETDLTALRVVISWLNRIGFIQRRADLPALYEEFAASLREELDYIQEAENADRFADNFAEDPGVEMPRPMWELTTGRVLVLERIHGIKINTYSALEDAGVSRQEVAHRLFRLYLRQIFVDGFFHADPHPGNLFVRPDPTGPPVQRGVRFVLIFVDFGMVGTIPTDVRDRLRDVLIAVIQRDFRRIVRLAKELNFLLPEADETAVARALETLFERYYGMPLGELSKIDIAEVEGLISEFKDLLYQFPFQVPQNFILLGRCLGILNGQATGLDPDFNPVEEIEPFARRLLGEQAGPELETLLQNTLEWLSIVAALPREVNTTMRFLRDTPVSVIVNEEDKLTQGIDNIEGAINRFTDTILLIWTSTGGYLLHQEEPLLAWSLWAISLVLVVRLWWRR